jgi:hypothetical protein
MTNPPQNAPFGVPIDHDITRYQSVPNGGYVLTLVRAGRSPAVMLSTVAANATA